MPTRQRACYSERIVHRPALFTESMPRPDVASIAAHVAPGVNAVAYAPDGTLYDAAGDPHSEALRQADGSVRIRSPASNAPYSGFKRRCEVSSGRMCCVR